MTVKARIENGEVVVYDSNSPKPFQIIEGYENDFIVGVSYWGGESLTEEEWESFGYINISNLVFFQLSFLLMLMTIQCQQQQLQKYYQ